MKKSLIMALCIIVAGLVEAACFDAVTVYVDGLRLFWGLPLASLVVLMLACATGNETLADCAVVVAGVVIGAEVGLFIGLMIFDGILGVPIGLLAVAGYSAYAIH